MGDVDVAAVCHSILSPFQDEFLDEAETRLAALKHVANTANKTEKNKLGDKLLIYTDALKYSPGSLKWNFYY